MEIGIYEPPPRSPSPPPPRKHRSALIMGGLFVVAFLGALALLGRHELAAMIADHTASKAVVAETHFPVPPPPLRTPDAASQQPPPAQPQAAAMPPSVFQ
jgi:hypothetical protein